MAKTITVNPASITGHVTAGQVCRAADVIMNADGSTIVKFTAGNTWVLRELRDFSDFQGMRDQACAMNPGDVIPNDGDYDEVLAIVALGRKLEGGSLSPLVVGAGVGLAVALGIVFARR